MKMKSHLFFLCLIFFSFKGLAQDHTEDSLLSILSKSREDTAKVKLLLRLSKFYLNSNPETGKQYGMRALQLAKALKFLPGEALALKNVGYAYRILGDFPATLDYYGQALRVYDSAKDMEGQAIILNNIGSVYYLRGADDKALENFFKSLEVSEKIGDKLGIATAYSNLGSVYNTKRPTREKALTYFWKALELSEEISDKNIIGGVCVNVGEIYYDFNKYDSALFYFYRSLKAYENTVDLPYPLRDIGLVYSQKGDVKKAVQYFLQSYQMAKKFDSKLDMTQALKSLGDTYFKQAEYQSALNSYKEAESIAFAIPANKELNDAYSGIAATYSNMGDFRNAYKYQKLFSSLSDTLNNQVLADKLTTLQTNFEILSRQNQINLLTKDKAIQELDLRSQKIQKAFISAALILIFFIAFVIYRNYRDKVKTNIVLDRQKAEIEGLLLNILPSKVATELQMSGSATPRYYEQVSVLFTDFKGFTLIADALSPQEVVSELNACFIAFDDIIEKYKLEKIKTIGDSYMCAGGIPTENSFHPVNIVQAALEIRDWMKRWNEKRSEVNLPPWELRIGIHVGPVVAGVVGRKKYAYDIWGSTVNIASRIESSGHPGMVNISEATYNLVKDKYTCFYRGKISAKSIGDIDMYFVEKEVVYMETAMSLQ